MPKARRRARQRDAAGIEYFEVQNVIGIYQKRAENVPAEMMPIIGEALVTQVLDVFETEGYGEWEPYAESTLNRKLFGPRRTPNPKLLQDTGNLVGSITPVWDEASGEVSAYTNVPYGVYHTSRAPRRQLPMRDFWAIDVVFFEEDVAQMLEFRVARDPVAAE